MSFDSSNTPPESFPSPDRGDRYRLSLPSPRSLVGALPHLLGYQPSRQLVVVLLRDGRLQVTAAVDLPPLDEAALVWRALNLLVGQVRPDAALLIAYGDEDADLVVLECKNAAPVPVHLAARVSDARLWVLDCDNPDCCPPGMPIETDPQVAATLTAVTGSAPLPHRDALGDCLTPAADDVLARVNQHLAELPPRPTDPIEAFARLDDARRARADGSVTMTERDAAQLLYALTDVHVRDTCLGWAARDDAWWLWLDLIRLTPRSHVPRVATLIASTAYAQGNGPMALTAARHALRVNPSYELARLIVWANSLALPATEFVDGLREASDLAAKRLADDDTSRP